MDVALWSAKRFVFGENLLPSMLVVESVIFLLLVLNMWGQLSLNLLSVRFVTSFGAGIRVANVNFLRGGNKYIDIVLPDFSRTLRRYFICKALLQWHQLYQFDGLRDLESSVATLVSVTESCGDGAHWADMP